MTFPSGIITIFKTSLEILFSCKKTFYCFFIIFFPNKRLMVLLFWLFFFSLAPLFTSNLALTYSGCYCRFNRAKRKLFCVRSNTLSMPLSSGGNDFIVYIVSIRIYCILRMKYFWAFFHFILQI